MKLNLNIWMSILTMIMFANLSFADVWTSDDDVIRVLDIYQQDEYVLIDIYSPAFFKDANNTLKTIANHLKVTLFDKNNIRHESLFVWGDIAGSTCVLLRLQNLIK